MFWYLIKMFAPPYIRFCKARRVSVLYQLHTLSGLVNRTPIWFVLVVGYSFAREVLIYCAFYTIVSHLGVTVVNQLNLVCCQVSYRLSLWMYIIYLRFHWPYAYNLGCGLLSLPGHGDYECASVHCSFLTWRDIMMVIFALYFLSSFRSYVNYIYRGCLLLGYTCHQLSSKLSFLLCEAGLLLYRLRSPSFIIHSLSVS